MDENRTKQLADSLFKKLSSQIQPWINETWPDIKDGQLPFESAHGLLNGFINFAGINLACLFRTIAQSQEIPFGSEEYNLLRDNAAKDQATLLTNVFLQNLIKQEEEAHADN